MGKRHPFAAMKETRNSNDKSDVKNDVNEKIKNRLNASDWQELERLLAAIGGTTITNESKSVVNE